MGAQAERRGSTKVLIGLVVLLGVTVLVLATEVRRRGQELDRALGLVARTESLDAKIDEMETRFSRDLERELTDVRAEWDALMYQKARLDVRHRHDASQRALRVLGTGLGSYQVDYNFYPPTLDWLEPNYVAHVSAKDAWGNNVVYEARKRDGRRGSDRPTSYKLSGAGQDGKIGTSDDYRYEDGMFTYLPDVRSLKVEPLELPGPDSEPPVEETENPRWGG